MSTLVKKDTTRSEAEIEAVEAFESLEEKDYVPSVSFDTVPLLAGIACEESDEEHDCDDHILEYTEDEYYNDETYAESSIYSDRNRGYSPPPGSGNSMSLIDSRIDGLDGFHIGRDGKITRTDYPTRPTIVNEALVLNKVHKDWLSLWRQRKNLVESRLAAPTGRFVFPSILFPPEKNTRPNTFSGLTPLTKEERRKALIIGKKVGFPNSPRTIVCHISGKKHTWIGLDWLLKRYAQDVDHLVIIANIPKMSNHKSRSRSRSRSAAPRSRSAAPASRHYRASGTLQRSFPSENEGEQSQQKDERWLEWASGYDAGHIKRVLKNILVYVVSIMPRNRAVKVTVEIVIGKTKKILVDCMNVYFPDLIVLSSLRSKQTESMVKWKSRYLIDKACQTFPVPIVLVPVKQMMELESKVRDDLDEEIKRKGKKRSESADEIPRLHHSKTAPDVMDHTEASSHSASTNSVNGDPTTSVEDQGTDGESVASSLSNKSPLTDMRLRDELVALRKETKTRIWKFENDNSIPQDEQLVLKVDTVLKSTLKFAAKLDELNQSTESLVELKREFTGRANPDSSGNKKSMLDVAKPSKVAHVKPSPNPARISVKDDTIPPKPQIKFAPEVKGKDGNKTTGIDSIERSMSHEVPLRPQSSQGVESSPRETDLRKVRSASGLKPVKSGSSLNSEIKKKSKSFFSFFKGSDSPPSSTVSSGSSSRRNSSGSDASGLLLNTPSKKRRSRFFGLKKS
ncbi:LANO_0H11232g1_1 [Lachancea nothofagi CBS 11611]|uniref:LANO_0H11232g1_1 n=1 Tax=Lachancea nothofagi CBS 11611 TaxID=1266666 RepID=A0A1G4KMG2_9SACH|nr:LANO_0H11232g1_1 [Lachancea nothofagi CBS 11611]